jgi:cytochrome c biogenesis protein CcmG/thiol:disulfide interchange protein DsbE
LTDSASTVEPAPPRRRLAASQIVVIAVVLLLIGLFAYGLLFRKEAPRPSSGTAPDFTLSLFPDYQSGYGDQVRLADLRGKVVVLNFWASWCDPCKEEAALLQNVSDAYADRGVIFLGADYLDQEPAALRYLQEFGVTYPNGPDLGSQIARRYRIQGVPETFFITPDGAIDWFKIGPLSQSELQGCLDTLLDGGSCQ